MIKPVIREVVANQVAEAIRQAVPIVVDEGVNADIASWGTQTKFEDMPLIFDEALVATPESNAKGYIGAIVNGTFFNPEKPAAIPYTLADLPLRDDTGLPFQIFISDYTVNTLLYARFLAQQEDNVNDYLGLLGL
jgi:hypothetical protein